MENKKIPTIIGTIVIIIIAATVGAFVWRYEMSQPEISQMQNINRSQSPNSKLILKAQQERVVQGINVYFKSETQEKDILDLKSKLEKLDAVNSVMYISKEEAFKKFQSDHVNDPTISKALESYDKNQNPMLTILKVEISNPDKCESIKNYVSDSSIVFKIQTIYNESIDSQE